jgi:hypothetical protein
MGACYNRIRDKARLRIAAADRIWAAFPACDYCVTCHLNQATRLRESCYREVYALHHLIGYTGVVRVKMQGREFAPLLLHKWVTLDVRSMVNVLSQQRILASADCQAACYLITCWSNLRSGRPPRLYIAVRHQHAAPTPPHHLPFTKPHNQHCVTHFGPFETHLHQQATFLLSC